MGDGGAFRYWKFTKRGILFGGERKRQIGDWLWKRWGRATRGRRLCNLAQESRRWLALEKKYKPKKSQVCLHRTAGGKTERFVFAGTDLCFYWELKAHRCYSRKRCKCDVTAEGEGGTQPTNLFHHSSPAQYMLLFSRIFFSLLFFSASTLPSFLARSPWPLSSYQRISRSLSLPLSTSLLNA